VSGGETLGTRMYERLIILLMMHENEAPSGNLGPVVQKPVSLTLGYNTNLQIKFSNSSSIKLNMFFQKSFLVQ
jgi:hypothetical protein